MIEKRVSTSAWIQRGQPEVLQGAIGAGFSDSTSHEAAYPAESLRVMVSVEDGLLSLSCALKYRAVCSLVIASDWVGMVG
jgi:hypothetical protein